MAFASSKIFRAFLKDALDNTTAYDLGSDIPKVALYGNTGTPDQDVTSANSAYAVGQWVTGNEVIDSSGGGTDWPAGGKVLGTINLDAGTAATVFYDAADTASGATADITAAYGCLVYDDTLTTPVADQGICFNYFGGSNSVVAGTFTVVWHANGIFRFTL